MENQECKTNWIWKERGGRNWTERLSDNIARSHTAAQAELPNFTYFFKVHFHVKGFLEFWWKFANLVSASFLAHSTAQFSFIPALSSHCHSTFLWQWKCYSKSGWWWRRWWWSKVRSKLNAMFIFLIILGKGGLLGSYSHINWLFLYLVEHLT